MKLLHAAIYLTTTLSFTAAKSNVRRAAIALPQLPGLSPNNPALLARQGSSSCCEASCCPSGYICSCPVGSYCDPDSATDDRPCVCYIDCPDVSSVAAGGGSSSYYVPDFSSSFYIDEPSSSADVYYSSSSTYVYFTTPSSTSFGAGGAASSFNGGGPPASTSVPVSGGGGTGGAAPGVSRELLDWYLVFGTAITGGIVVAALIL